VTRGRVLIADDDDAFRFALRKALARLDYDVDEASGGEEALGKLRGRGGPDACLLDLHMDDMDGLEVLRRLGGVSETPVVVLTGHGSVQAAVEAMSLGAYSFLEKPVDADVLRPLLGQMLGEHRRGTAVSIDVPPLVGESPPMAEIKSFVDRVAPTDETVAVYGETGTGKEVVARNLHAESPRRGQPFVALNAACVPRELFESELFGHKRGAFTGATSDRTGLFRDADGGTLFIDEVAELPFESQAKLLRALEARRIRPVGESKEIPVDVRIVAATNRDLWHEVQDGRFREDLYFRLQVFPVVLPPLRDRPEDLDPLARHLLDRIGSPVRSLSDGAREVFYSHHWPGNVRELLNVLRRASLFADGATLDEELARRMIAASVFAQGAPSRPQPEPARVAAGAFAGGSGGNGASGSGDGASARRSSSPPAPPATGGGAGAFVGSLADVERAHIEHVLSQEGGNVTRAANVLGIDRRTLQRKMKAYGLS